VDARYIREIAERSARDTADRLGRDVKLGIIVTLFVALLSAWRGLPWREVTVLTVIAWASVLVGAFLLRFARNLRHPDQHESWTRQDSQIIPYTDHTELRLTLEPTEPLYVGGSKCEITAPDGTVWSEPGSGEEEPRLVRRLYCVYPASFPGAPPLTSGAYKVRWLLGSKSGKWREILRHTERVSF
jgi:hypothetical protein